MERNGFRSSLKEHKGKESMNKKLQNGYGDEEDYLVGFSWPPRSYTCSFCKREFRSAQALGGHMNVHRRDRARLRQYSPNSSKDLIGKHSYLNLNLSPSPNPNPNLSSSSSTFGAPPTEMMKRSSWGLTIFSSSPVNASYISNEGKSKSYFELSKDLHPFSFKENECIMTLNQEIGHGLSDSKDDLDLELRLGYSA